MTMSRPKWIAAAGALLVLAAIAWYFASPLYTLDRMRAAAEAGDSAALAAYVDFPALREDVKTDLTARLMQDAQKEQGGLGPLGALLGAAVIGPVVEGLVSPAGLRAAFAARKGRGGETSSQPRGPVQVAEKPVIKRRGLSEFLVASEEEPDSGLVFVRHGLGWRLSGIDLPQGRAGTK
jgi:hypothetical protein